MVLWKLHRLRDVLLNLSDLTLETKELRLRDNDVKNQGFLRLWHTSFFTWLSLTSFFLCRKTLGRARNLFQFWNTCGVCLGFLFGWVVVCCFLGFFWGVEGVVLGCFLCLFVSVYILLLFCVFQNSYFLKSEKSDFIIIALGGHINKKSQKSVFIMHI